MHGVGLDRDVRTWFEGMFPAVKVRKTLIADALSVAEQRPDDTARVVWLGERPLVGRAGRSSSITLPGRDASIALTVPTPVAEWLVRWLSAAMPRGRQGAPYPSLADLTTSYPGRGSFESWTGGRTWRRVIHAGLVIL
jgi:hypothetical protein